MRKAIVAAAMSVALGSLSTLHAVNVSPSSDGTALVNALLGSGITIVGTPTLIGGSNQQGFFNTGMAEVGFDSGIVLTSGSVNNIPGPNSADDITTALGTSGDSDLTTLSGFPTYDANILEFDFQFDNGTVGGDLFFNYVFGSDEYEEYVNSQFNDTFAFFVDGTNLGVVPGTSTPVSVNTVNQLMNTAYYRPNLFSPSTGTINIEYDGLTTVLQASATGLAAGTHHIKIGIADASDEILDSGIFLQGSSFADQPTAIPEPGFYGVLGMGLAGLMLYQRRRQRQSIL